MVMNAKTEPEAPHPVANPKRKWLDKKGILLLVAAFILVLALALGLGLGLGLKGKNNETLTNTKPPQSWRRDPQDYVLSTSFDTKAPSTTRTYTLNLTEIPNGAPDGVSRRMLLINGQFPGPVIEVNEGDRLVVQVNNFMTLPSAIHWHGQYQNGSPSPILPNGRNQLYGWDVRNHAMRHSTKYVIHVQFYNSAAGGYILVPCSLVGKFRLEMQSNSRQHTKTVSSVLSLYMIATKIIMSMEISFSW